MKRLGFTVATANHDPGKDAKSDDTLTPLEKLKRKYDVQLKCQSSANKFHEEIQSYLAIPEPSEEEEILPWWDDHKKMFPVLYKLAKHYLCIPAASSKSERVFSCAGNTVTTRRTRLDANKVEMLVVLKQNQQLVKDYEQ